MKREPQRMSLLKLLAATAGALLGALVISRSLPDLRRYARMLRM